MTEQERTDTGTTITGKGPARGKTVLLKSLRNYLVANVCALLPLLWVGLGWMPDQVKISWRGEDEAPLAVMCDGLVLQGEDHGRWAEGRVWRYYLREGMEWKELAFRLPEGKGAENIGQIELQKWKLLRGGKAGRSLRPVQGEEGSWKFENPRFEWVGFASRKMMAGVCFLELLLLVVSWLFASRVRGESWKALWPSVICVAMALSALTQVALPVQSYLANQSSYPFSAGELAVAVTIRFGEMWTLTAVSLLLLARCFGRLVLGIAFAFAVCMELESSVLAAGLPNLNGDWWFFQNKPRAIWDATAWGTVFALVLGLYPILKRWLGWIAVGWLVMVASATVFDVEREDQADTSTFIVHDFSSFETVLRSVTYSTNRNVLVFIIDSLERETAHEIMEDPEAGAKLREQFEGFTEYWDNVGAANQTLTADPNLLTGEYPENPLRMIDYYWSVFSSQSALKNYLESGFAVYMTANGLGCGYATQHEEGETVEQPSTSVFKQPTKWGEQWLTLEKLNRFRSLPFLAKAPYAYLMSLTSGEDNPLREWAVYPMLKDGKVKEDGNGTFLFVHTEGVHMPILYDRRGNFLPAADNSEKGNKEMGIFLLTQLGELLDFFRNCNLYDASLIIVAADHGQHGEHEYFQSEATGVLPGNARPFLWVKPPRSRHAFKTSMLPTSLSRIAGLLKAAACKDVGAQEIEKLLQANKRLYRWGALHGSGWKDWVVEADGTVAFTETEYDASSLGGEMVPLQAGKVYSLSLANTARIKETILFSNVENLRWPALISSRQDMALSFKVADAHKKHVLRLRLKSWRKTSIRFRQDLPGSDWAVIALDAGEDREVVLENLEPNAHGIIKIFGERIGMGGGDILFNQLIVD